MAVGTANLTAQQCQCKRRQKYANTKFVPCHFGSSFLCGAYRFLFAHPPTTLLSWCLISPAFWSTSEWESSTVIRIDTDISTHRPPRWVSDRLLWESYDLCSSSCEGHRTYAVAVFELRSGCSFYCAFIPTLLVRRGQKNKHVIRTHNVYTFMRDIYVLAYLRFVRYARPWYSWYCFTITFCRAATSFQDYVISTKDVRVLCKHTGAGSAEWNVG